MSVDAKVVTVILFYSVTEKQTRMKYLYQEAEEKKWGKSQKKSYLNSDHLGIHLGNYFLQFNPKFNTLFCDR